MLKLSRQDIIKRIANAVIILIFWPIFDKFLRVVIYGLGEGFKIDFQLLIIPVGIVEIFLMLRLVYRSLSQTQNQSNNDAREIIETIQSINKVEKKKIPLGWEK